MALNLFCDCVVIRYGDLPFHQKKKRKKIWRSANKVITNVKTKWVSRVMIIMWQMKPVVICQQYCGYTIYNIVLHIHKYYFSLTFCSPCYNDISRAHQQWVHSLRWSKHTQMFRSISLCKQLNQFDHIHSTRWFGSA